MTLVPAPGPAKARDDLPGYPRANECAHPDCGFSAMLEDHHMWRRQSRRFRHAFWVQVGERILPCRVWLCAIHHRELTDNRARILWVEEDESYHWLSRTDEGWESEGELDPHPPLGLEICEACGQPKVGAGRA